MAVVLSEIVSLVTAKLVGMGIIGHQFSLSWSAIELSLIHIYSGSEMISEPLWFLMKMKMPAVSSEELSMPECKGE